MPFCDAPMSVDKETLVELLVLLLWIFEVTIVSVHMTQWNRVNQLKRRLDGVVFHKLKSFNFCFFKSGFESGRCEDATM